MNLGAMIDLGIDPEYLLFELAKLPLSGEYVLDVQKGIKNGMGYMDDKPDQSHPAGLMAP